MPGPLTLIPAYPPLNPRPPHPAPQLTASLTLPPCPRPQLTARLLKARHECLRARTRDRSLLYLEAIKELLRGGRHDAEQQQQQQQGMGGCGGGGAALMREAREAEGGAELLRRLPYCFSVLFPLQVQSATNPRPAIDPGPWTLDQRP